MIDFPACQAQLLQIFAANDFARLHQERAVRTAHLQTFASGAAVFAMFPGYKTRVDGPAVVAYDYRVDFGAPGTAPIALSHVNIIVDLYHKVNNKHLLGTDLERIILALYQERTPIDEHPGVAAHPRQDPPGAALLQQVAAALRAVGKPYDPRGNAADLGLLELCHLIKWIVLQEDINYPRGRGYEGRQMALARYQEAIYVAQTHAVPLAEVLARAVAHRRQRPWPEVRYGRCC